MGVSQRLVGRALEDERDRRCGDLSPVDGDWRLAGALVFEIAFEWIQPSSRHKSGEAVRFPRIHRWRHDNHVADADILETLKALLPG